MQIKKLYRLEVGIPERVQIVLVGCGGTGSYTALHLAQLAYTAHNHHNIDIDLIFIDPDIVETKNVSRQNFAPGEVGQPKAIALARRYSMAFGLAIRPMVEPFVYGILPTILLDPTRFLNVIVGCVDTTTARHEIHRELVSLMGLIKEYRGRNVWWLDAGNDYNHGQILLGNSDSPEPLLSPLGFAYSLPLPSLQEPALIKQQQIEQQQKDKLQLPESIKLESIKPAVPEPDTQPEPDLSCAELTALGVQARTINKMMATWIDVYLERLIISKDLKMMATILDQRSGTVYSRYIDHGQVTLLDTAGAQARADQPADDIPEHLQCPQCGHEVAFGDDMIDMDIGIEEIVFCTHCDFRVSQAVWEDALGEIDPYAMAWGNGWDQDDIRGAEVEDEEAEMAGEV